MHAALVRKAMMVQRSLVMEGHLDCWLGRLKKTMCVVSEGRDLWNIWWPIGAEMWTFMLK
jgi:hypothetical protein